MAAVDETHRLGQLQLQRTVGGAVFGLLEAITLERSPEVREAYAATMRQLVGGGQRAAVLLALAYMSAYAAPVEPIDMDETMAPVLAGSGAKSYSGLLRFWRQVDRGVEVPLARRQAGMYARNLAEGDMQAAQRAGLDAGAAATRKVTRWRKVAGPNACEWCREIAGGPAPARYFRADTVPFHTVGPCRCGVAPELVEARLTSKGWQTYQAGAAPPPGVTRGDWAATLDEIKGLDTEGWFRTGEGADEMEQQRRMIDIGRRIDAEAMRRYEAAQARSPVFYPDSVKLRADMRRAVLAEIRAMGGGLSVSIARDKRFLGAAIKAGQFYYPTEWINRLNELGPWKISKVNRGNFDVFGKRIRISDWGRGLTGEQAAAETAIHEIGHGMQWTRPQLARAEHLFHVYRTTDSVGRREPIARLPGYRRNEIGRPDWYPQAYSGREYRMDVYHEVLTTTAQSVFSPASTDAAGAYYADDEMMNWLLGAMALL